MPPVRPRLRLGDCARHRGREGRRMTVAFTLPETRAREESAEGRYEFRCWPATPAKSLGALSRYGQIDACETRADIYILSRLTHRVLVKLRGGDRLEIKTLDFFEWPLQHWRMALSTPFPLNKEDMGLFRHALDLGTDFPGVGGETPAHLVASLAEVAPFAPMCTVEKTRALYSLGGCRAEATIARFRGNRHVTIGLEGEDRQAMARTLETLGVSGLSNRHYGDTLAPRPHSRILFFS